MIAREALVVSSQEVPPEEPRPVADEKAASSSAVEQAAWAEQASDDELMARAAAGDQGAFRVLMARHYRRVFGLVYRMLPNTADAEDLAQDVFFTVWLKRADWQPGAASFTTWLYRVTINRCIDAKRRRRPECSDDLTEIEDDRPDAAAVVQQQQASQILRRATLKLSNEQQAALALFYHQGLSNAEAAEILGTTVSAVESLLKRARNRLREILRNRSKDLIGDSG